MKKIDHFEEGKFYMYSVELRLKGDNTVADDCEMNVNGHWAHHIKTVNGVFAPNADNMLCEQPIDEWRAIDVIEINGATTTFKAGDKPVLRRMFRRALTPFLSVSSGRAAMAAK